MHLFYLLFPKNIENVNPRWNETQFYKNKYENTDFALVRYNVVHETLRCMN